MTKLTTCLQICASKSQKTMIERKTSTSKIVQNYLRSGVSAWHMSWMTDRKGMREEKGNYMRNRFYYLCKLNIFIFNSIHISKEGILKCLQSIHHPSISNPRGKLENCLTGTYEVWYRWIWLKFFHQSVFWLELNIKSLLMWRTTHIMRANRVYLASEKENFSSHKVSKYNRYFMLYTLCMKWF